LLPRGRLHASHFSWPFMLVVLSLPARLCLETKLFLPLNPPLNVIGSGAWRVSLLAIASRIAGTLGFWFFVCLVHIHAR
jgi:hypothetical protein